MAIYALGLTPFLEMMLSIVTDQNEGMVAFADDLTAVGKTNFLKEWWDQLATIGLLFEYLPQPSKSWLIVKKDKLAQVKETFKGTRIQITTSGQKHLGAAIGETECKKK